MTSKPHLSKQDRKNIGAAFSGRSKDDIPNFGFGERDPRSFADIMTDWMIALDGDLNNAAPFLKKTGLQDALTEAQWQGLASGTFAPSKKLAGLLYVLMENSVNQHGNAQTNLRMPSFELFMNRAEKIRNREFTEQREENIIDISDEVHRALRLPLLQKLRDQIFPRVAAAWEAKDAPEDKPTTAHALPVHPILTICSNLMHSTPKETLQNLVVGYKRSPDDMVAALEAICIDVTPEDIRAWCDATLKPSAEKPPHIGLMIRLLRQSQGDFIDAYDGIHLPQSNGGTINGRWERGRCTPEPWTLPTLKACFSTTPAEYQLLAESLLPHFNDDWLNAQPPRKQAGHYLRRLMVDKGILPSQLEKMIGGKWQTIMRFIDRVSREKSNMNKLLQALDPSPQERILFAHYLSAPKRAEQNNLKVFFEDTDKYFTEHTIEPKEQALHMLTLCRNITGSTEKSIAEFCQCAESNINALHNGKTGLSPKYSLPMAEFFAEKDPKNTWFDKEKFLAVCSETYAAQKADHKPPGPKPTAQVDAPLDEQRKAKQQSNKEVLKTFFENKAGYCSQHNITIKEQALHMLTLCMDITGSTNKSIAERIGCSESNVRSLRSGKAWLSPKYSVLLADFFAQKDPESTWFDQKKFLAVCSETYAQKYFTSPDRLAQQHANKNSLKAFFEDTAGYCLQHNIPIKEQSPHMLTLCMGATGSTHQSIGDYVGLTRQNIWLIRNSKITLPPQYSVPMAEFFAQKDPESTWFDKDKFLAVCSETYAAQQADQKPLGRKPKIQLGAILTPEKQREAGLELTDYSAERFTRGG